MSVAKRKVIQLAGKTLVVSLPSKWARKMGIRKGDELEIEEKDNGLAVTAHKETIVDKATLDAKKLDERALRWSLSALHKSGYDEIEVMYESPETAKVIHETLKDLFTGFAVTEQSRNRCVLRSIAKELETEFDSVLRRAFLVTLSLGESLAEYLESNKTAQLQDLLALESTNNQLTNFCERILIKKGYKDYRKTCFVYVIAWNLEKICDNYKYIINYIGQIKKGVKVREETTKLITESTALLRAYYELYYKFEPIRLNELIGQKRKIEEEARKLLGKGTEEDAVVISHALHHITQIADFSASFIATHMD
ncbi:AbrB/MazE/SpoVT family DNA-binding domain-containing protein [Candidatus Woesearchaeota archaeon]|nr:AbrB/MazE/SpoVT family DNA-binding domain-containing protein [Candidatus Woesearchaeota archaeon]